METNVRSVYNQWATTYDLVENKTRDLDKVATQTMLAELIATHSRVMELGCGTGKNTEWLISKTRNLTAVDFSDEMLSKAREKFSDPHLVFRQADITLAWPFEDQSYDLITCNLVLEHVQNLNIVFSEAKRVLKTDGQFFISELHPFKQYLGSKARFEINNTSVSPDCFTHHISDYFSAASGNGFSCMGLQEWFDNNETESVPRLISFLFKRTD